MADRYLLFAYERYEAHGGGAHDLVDTFESVDAAKAALEIPDLLDSLRGHILKVPETGAPEQVAQFWIGAGKACWGDPEPHEPPDLTYGPAGCPTSQHPLRPTHPGWASVRCGLPGAVARRPTIGDVAEGIDDELDALTVAIVSLGDSLSQELAGRFEAAAAAHDGHEHLERARRSVAGRGRSQTDGDCPDSRVRDAVSVAGYGGLAACSDALVREAFEAADPADAFGLMWRADVAALWRDTVTAAGGSADVAQVVQSMWPTWPGELAELIEIAGGIVDGPTGPLPGG